MSKKKIEVMEYPDLAYTSLLDFSETDEFRDFAARLSGKVPPRFLRYAFERYAIYGLSRYRRNTQYLGFDETADHFALLLETHGYPAERLDGFLRTGIRGYTIPTSFGFEHDQKGPISEVVFAYMGVVRFKKLSELGFITRVFQRQRQMGLYPDNATLNIFGPMDFIQDRFYPDEFSVADLRLRLSVCLLNRSHVRKVFGRAVTANQ